MRRVFLSLALLAAAAGPALAYDACGAPPERPDLPANPAAAAASDMNGVREADRDFALDVEGYLVCTQLADSDVGAEAERGDRTAASAEALRKTFQDQAAEARGRQSGWRDDYDRWIAAWARAHHQPVPSRLDN